MPHPALETGPPTRTQNTSHLWAAMPIIRARFDGDGIMKMLVAAEALTNRTPDALRRALNHTGDKANTRVKRALSQQIKAPQAAIVQYGRVRPVRANFGSLTYEIVSSGGPIPLKYFKPSQTRKGVSAAPWGNRKIYKSAFMNGMGGHVFWRKGKARLPIERIAGPNVPKELVKDQSAAAFLAVSAELPVRLAHEIRVLTKGIVS